MKRPWTPVRGNASLGRASMEHIPVIWAPQRLKWEDSVQGQPGPDSKMWFSLVYIVWSGHKQQQIITKWSSHVERKRQRESSTRSANIGGSINALLVPSELCWITQSNNSTFWRGSKRRRNKERARRWGGVRDRVGGGISMCHSN